MDRQEAIKVVRDNWPEGRVLLKSALGILIPELKKSESEDERIRKAIKLLIELKENDSIGLEPVYGASYKEMISWLEKQGEQKQHLELKAGHWYFCHQAYCERADILTVKEGETFKCEKDGIVKGLIIKEPKKYFREISTPSDKVEPKFKVGDWIINSKGMLRHIVDVDKTGYQTDNGWLTHANYEKGFHLWTIQDARNCDVLEFTDHERVVIGIVSFVNKRTGKIDVSCLLENNNFKLGNFYALDTINPHPATKEQRDLLFQKMKEAGYEWDDENKKLKKIEQNPAWSKEDEKYYDSALWHIKNSCKKEGNVYNWLKSLRPQNRWKPSKEQIIALRWVLNNVPYNKHKEEISGLLDQIKNL